MQLGLSVGGIWLLPVKHLAVFHNRRRPSDSAVIGCDVVDRVGSNGHVKTECNRKYNAGGIG